MPASLLTPLLADDSPLDVRSRALVVELFEAEARLMSALPPTIRSTPSGAGGST